VHRACLLVVGLALVAAGDARACEESAACRAARFRAAAEYFASDVACDLRPTPVSVRSCHDAATAALERTLARADATQGCTVAADAGALASAVAGARSATELSRLLGFPDRHLRCARARWHGVAQLARGVLQARARDAARPDAAHLAAVQLRLESQLARTLARALRAGDCNGGVGGDVAAVAEVVAQLAENVCPICGSDRVGTGEQCDGADAPCPGRCTATCSCPAAFCGNDVVEAGEECDGTDVALCPATSGYAQCAAAGRADACRCQATPVAADACAVPPAAPTCPGQSCASVFLTATFPPQAFHACLATEPASCETADDCALVGDGCRRGACCAAIGGLCGAANPCCDGTSCGLFGNGSPGVCCRNPLEPCLRNEDCCQGLCELGAGGEGSCAFF
jgi:hypothetical protein